VSTGRFEDGRRFVRVEIAGTPAPQGSKTIATGGGRTWTREDNRATEPWRNAVAAAAIDAMDGDELLAGPLLLEATFRFPRPKHHYGTGRNAGKVKASAPTWVATRPDLDKLVRAVADALAGIAYQDDSQIAEHEAVKCYGTPGLELTLYEIGGHR
jgi:crossover junction endodeoxyribonuclease RusA